MDYGTVGQPEIKLFILDKFYEKKWEYNIKVQIFRKHMNAILSIERESISKFEIFRKIMKIVVV